MSRRERILGRAVFFLTCGLIVSACTGLSGQTKRTLAEELTGSTVIFDPPEGLPATRSTYHADGTFSALSRPLLVPDKLYETSGYWWIEKGRYCSSGNPRAETEVSSCYTVTIKGDRIRFTPWEPPRLIEIFPDLRREREGRLIRGSASD